MVKFLIIRFSSIGDIVLTTPVIRGLKSQVEDAEIHYLTKPPFAEILQANPYISKTFTFSDRPDELIQTLKEESYDYIIDLHNSLRSRRIKFALKRMYFTVNKVNARKWLYVNLKIDVLPDLHIVDRYMHTLHVFEVNNDSSGLDYFIPREDEIDIQQLGKDFSSGYIAFAIGAQHQTKLLPLEKIVEIIENLSSPVILIGGPEDEQKGVEILKKLPQKKLMNGCGKWRINQSASIIKQANLVLGHDSGMTHIAAAFKKKVITVWGNTTPRFGMSPYLPDPLSEYFEVPGLKCRPCSKLGKKSCPRKHFKCMNDQDSLAIAAKANALFKKN
ncbi:glycosyltransferase family 9 protein [Bacteroidota bacterium]